LGIDYAKTDYRPVGREGEQQISAAGHSWQNATKQNQDDDSDTDPDDEGGGKLRWLVAAWAPHEATRRRPPVSVCARRWDDRARLD